MSYLQRLGLNEANYDLRPCVSVPGHETQCWRGWDAVGSRLREALNEQPQEKTVLAVECYPGVLNDEVVPALRKVLTPDLWLETEAEAFKSPAAIDAMVEPELGAGDPVFGRFTRLSLSDWFDTSKARALRAQVQTTERGLIVVYGPGALLCCDPDIILYADMPRWEAQQRQRAHRVSNLGVQNKDLKASLLYKRSYFVDWRVCDELKRTTMERWSFLLDTTAEGDPKLITGDALRAGLEIACGRPFRVVPFFDPGVWGGQWMREICQLPEEPPNYAWCFDCVPEENSLLLEFGETQVEIPAINLVFRHPDELLGEPVHGRFGAEFPIRFDLLDTMQGQNLSFQVHPMADYAYQHFGLRYTQDESYYILDAEDDAEVYLGLADDVDRTRMLDDLKTASENPDKPFPDTKHVARFPARRHDHFLIPAGTCHCSGANSLVLEISHTPYIFTFKMWDWGRVDLNGMPRPIHLERAAENIQWNRTRSWVEPRLVNAVEPVARGEGWIEERTGLYQSQAFETRRHWFTGTVEHNTHKESVHVLNLVAGAEAIVESPSGSFAPFVVHFAETFIIPAAVGAYTIRPHGPSVGKECATMKAFVRTNA